MRRRVLPALIALLLCLPAIGSRAEVAWTMPEGVAAAVLTDGTGAAVLCEGNADEPMQVAGLARLPALLTLADAFDNGAIDGGATMHVSARAAGIGGPTAFLESGEQMAAAELMKAAVMISAGDAIMALGEGAFGSESVFVENINATLQRLGLDCAVSDALGSSLVLSARDVATLGAAAVGSETFLRYSGLYFERLVHADGRETELVSANQLVRTYAGCVGLLTGSSSTDGYCGVFAAVRSGTTFIAVVLGAGDPSTRASAASAMLDFGFAAYRVETLLRTGDTVARDVPVDDGTVRTIDLVVREEISLLLPRSEALPEAKTEAPALLPAPLAADTAVGKVSYYNAEGVLLAEAALYPASDVPAFGILDILHAIFRGYLGLPPGV